MKIFISKTSQRMTSDSSLRSFKKWRKYLQSIKKRNKRRIEFGNKNFVKQDLI
jgi:hypothetical protein